MEKKAKTPVPSNIYTVLMAVAAVALLIGVVYMAMVNREQAGKQGNGNPFYVMPAEGESSSE